MKREINIKVKYNLDKIDNITERGTVYKIVEKDMENHFGLDEGYNGVYVTVTDIDTSKSNRGV